MGQKAATSRRTPKAVAVMESVHAIYADGVFRPTSPVSLPEQCEVEFVPSIVNPAATGEESLPPNPDEDAVLYHYCPLANFVKIVQEKNLRLTDMFSTNDKEEHRWLRKIAARVIDEEVKQPSGRYDDVTMRLLGRTPVDCDEIANINLACFSRRRDSLGQWRAYADDGHGVAIGFSRAYMLAKQSEMGQRYLELADVEYGWDRHEQLVHEAIAAAERERCAAVQDLTEAENETCDGVFRNAFFGELWKFAPRCKHRAFEEEQEVRVVCYPIWGRTDEDRALKRGHRTTRGAMTRYYELPIGVTGQPPIKEIMLGPKNTSRLRDIRSFLCRNGYDIPGTGLSKSEAPYR
jgi:hypothetical protein